MRRLLLASLSVWLAASACLLLRDRPGLAGRACDDDDECGDLACVGGVCGVGAEGEGDAGEGEGDVGEGEGEGAEGEGEGGEHGADDCSQSFISAMAPGVFAVAGVRADFGGVLPFELKAIAVSAGDVFVLAGETVMERSDLGPFPALTADATPSSVAPSTFGGGSTPSRILAPYNDGFLTAECRTNGCGINNQSLSGTSRNVTSVGLVDVVGRRDRNRFYAACDALSGVPDVERAGVVAMDFPNGGANPRQLVALAADEAPGPLAIVDDEILVFSARTPAAVTLLALTVAEADAAYDNFALVGSGGADFVFSVDRTDNRDVVRVIGVAGGVVVVLQDRTGGFPNIDNVVFVSLTASGARVTAGEPVTVVRNLTQQIDDVVRFDDDSLLVFGTTTAGACLERVSLP